MYISGNFVDGYFIQRWNRFVIQRHGARYFTTNDETDPDFAKALRHAQKHGVELWAYGCKISRRKIEIDHQVDIRI